MSINDCREIYRQAFGIEEDFEKNLFQNCSEYINAFYLDGKVVSFFFLLPCNVVTKAGKTKAKYLFAAATKEEEKKKGYMAKLIEAAKQKEDCPIFLRPANEHLTNYYKKQRFSIFLAQDITKKEAYIEPLDGFAKLCKAEKKNNEGEFPLMTYNLNLEINQIYFPFSMP